MKKFTFLLIVVLLTLTSCREDTNEKSLKDKDSEMFSIQEKNLKEYFEEAHGSVPDLQWNAAPVNLSEEKITKNSNELLTSLKLINEVDDIESYMNGNFISAKYRSGFNYIIQLGKEEPHKHIYLKTKDNNTYRLKTNKEIVKQLIKSSDKAIIQKLNQLKEEADKSLENLEKLKEQNASEEKIQNAQEQLAQDNRLLTEYKQKVGLGSGDIR